jgi:hypothetical protein
MNPHQSSFKSRFHRLVLAPPLLNLPHLSEVTTLRWLDDQLAAGARILRAGHCEIADGVARTPAAKAGSKSNGPISVMIWRTASRLLHHALRAV